MDKKEFLKNVWDHYTWIGLLFMGVVNCFLLLAHFNDSAPMPDTMILLALDAAFVIGFTLLGALIELIRMGIRKGKLKDDEPR